eukprot:1611301-Amphidinium_carterae.1
MATNIVTYDYHEFFLKAEGGLNLLFNGSQECRQAFTSALSSSLRYLQQHALQSHACVAILLFEAHTLIVLALRSTLHALESRRTEIGNLLTEFLQQTPIQGGDKQWLIVPHRIEWRGGSTPMRRLAYEVTLMQDSNHAIDVLLFLMKLLKSSSMGRCSRCRMPRLLRS